MPPNKKRLSLPGWLLLLSTAGAFLLYALFARRLQLLFEESYPQFLVFITSPGHAAVNAAALFGLIYIAPQWSTRPYARMFTIGFSLFLLGSLLNGIYFAWEHANRTQLDPLLFDNPTRFAIWIWWFRLNIPAAISAIGMLLIVMAGMGATCTSCKVLLKE